MFSWTFDLLLIYSVRHYFSEHQRNIVCKQTPKETNHEVKPKIHTYIFTCLWYWGWKNEELKFLSSTDTAFQRQQVVKLTRFQSFPLQLMDIKIYPYHLCCVINFNTLVGCSSLQDQLKTTSQWEHLNTDLKSVLQNINKFATGQTSLFLLIQEAAVYINFAMNCARCFRTSISYNIR